MPLTPQELAVFLTPPTSPTEGDRTAIQGFESMGHAASRHRQAELEQQRQAMVAEQQARAAKLAMAQLADEKAKRGAQLAKDRAAALQRLAPQLRDPLTRGRAVEELKQWFEVERQAAAVPAAPQLSLATPGLKAPTGAKPSISPGPLTMGGMAGITPPGELAPPGPAMPSPDDMSEIILRDPTGQELVFTPGLEEQEVKRRLESLIGNLAERAGAHEGAAYEQAKGAIRNFAELYYPEPEKAAQEALGLLNKRLQRESGERAAAFQGQKFEQATENLGWDKAREATKDSGIQDSAEAYRKWSQLQDVLKNPKVGDIPGLIDGLDTLTAKAFGEDRITDNDVRRVGGNASRSLVEQLNNEVKRLFVGGRHDEAVEHARKSAAIMRKAYSAKVLDQFHATAKMVRGLSPTEQEGAMSYLDSQLSSFQWYDDAVRVEIFGEELQEAKPARRTKGPSQRNVPEPTTVTTSSALDRLSR